MRYGHACDDGIFRRRIHAPTKNGAHRARRPAGLTAAARRSTGAPNSSGHPAVMHGHTYSQEEMRQSVLVPVDPRDYSKSATLEQEVKRFRKMDLLCSQIGSSSVNEPRDDIGDLEHFNSCKAVPRRELSPKEQCLIAALTARCTRSDDCLVSCLSSPDGALGAICNDGCFFIKRRDPDPPGWSECDTLPSIPSG